MIGPEITAVGKAAKVVGKKAFAEDEKTKDVLLRVAENTPEMRVAARSMATRIAVKEEIKLKLIQPIARLFGVRSIYIEQIFPQDMADKLVDVPVENIITPSPSIAIPAIQGLSYSFEEPSLKNLYLNLLSTASDERRADKAHPAFAEIIKQLAPQEANVLDVVLRKHQIAVVTLTDDDGKDNGPYEVLMRNLLPLIDEDTSEPKVTPQISIWADNWVRLGLIGIRYDEYFSDESMYHWVKTRPEYIRLAALPNVGRVNFNKGMLRVTDLGQQFFRAVGHFSGD
jgi:hypothetical protein